MNPMDLMTVLEKIEEIATSAAPKIVDISAKSQMERIAGLAASALSRNRAVQPGQHGSQGGN